MLTINFVAIWHWLLHRLARLLFLFTHRTIHIAPGISIFVKRPDKRSDVEIVRDALKKNCQQEVKRDMTGGGRRDSNALRRGSNAC